ncbi:GGDEF domain-containing protein [Actinophytocola algeriensis]|uniref:Diguanylate cyclase (GGDEF)-like protein n=1 Tax=Actinophytocola algeriensis TaxID=1768010 RepID=A0A7W7VIQ4_9PSEU|nr:GGDEF domain-containing protein [Actinophytocola algeriensis]MBB4911698.1 diguanylate cyclase (GGDEF)-like protein [Actinophytocola algeriensis]MBE1473314.1 diguanylate cyclase (GGDEF)-like protein [Actinophytocola algeriensis]
MGTGGAGGKTHVQDMTAALAVLFGSTVCGVVLAWPAVPSVWWGPGQTALPLVLCGVALAEWVRRRTRATGGSGVSAVSVWVVGAVVTLPLAAMLVVSSVLLAHDVLRGPRRGPRAGRVPAALAGATLAWFASSATSGVLAAVLAGLVYLAVTELFAVSREGQNAVSCAALGVLLGLFAQFSPLAVALVLLPVAYLHQSARGRALRYAAAHDPKTRLWNHAAWQTLSSAALASPRTRARSAVLMVDLDHFKRLNDTYGHHAGDDVLVGVARVLRTSTRRTDIVARFGGEEFSILLPGVTEEQARQAAERIRDQIAALTVPTTGLDGSPTTIRGVTASIGVATTGHAHRSVDALLVNADRWLYEAKEQGRNRVCGPALTAA